MTAPTYSRRGGFYCRYEGQYGQRGLGEPGAGRESSRLHITSKLNWAMRGARGRGKGEQERKRGRKRKTGESKRRGEAKRGYGRKCQGCMGMRSWGKGIL